ncbi:MAG: Digeranylgeranylglyceryl phosphate synthase [Candidatus Methanofastidiosum methylothiophilum]|uniref:Digeranylgeranylglyceryl phosphate synthase n=1 Tax=Candidatus Methanofastidiosum methylothiophilum TaxID=1705564 RepID=A0A150INU5_9EURY|nr:MAG: Digeranylgeranylglyceryl phosphate synthase [Candidatus Methanofastidiosum methylthiophilus]
MKKDTLFSWLKITRFQFYPMTWLAYTVGSLCSFKVLNNFDLTTYILGYVALFLIEFATVVSNEYFDYETDKINNNYSQFTGGSRMIVEGKITLNQAKNSILIAFVLVFLLGTILTSKYNIYTFFILSAGALLGLGYTVPPFKLSYRGLGEIDVGVTHSFYIVLAGFLLQSPTFNLSLPLILAIPLFFAIFGAIILGGFPDYESDKETGKRTLTVILGKRNASLISLISIFISLIFSIHIIYSSILGFASIFFIIVIVHGIMILYFLLNLLMANTIESRIDKLLQMSLSYILWFTLIPLLYLLNIF